jgi:ribosome-associated protein
VADQTCNALRVERSIGIAGDMIRLGQLLKLAGSASGGADAKALIASGQVTVNGEPELRRGRQLHPGDVVRVGTDDLRIVAA